MWTDFVSFLQVSLMAAQPAIVDALKAHPGDSKVVQESVYTLCNLAAHKENKTLVKGPGCVHPARRCTVDYGCSHRLTVCLRKPTQAAMLAAVSPILDVLRRPGCAPEVAEYSLGFLRNMSMAKENKVHAQRSPPPASHLH